AHDVHKQTVADVVDVVDRAMKHGVVEDEQRIVDPVVGLIVDFDENVAAVDRVEVVEYAEGQAQRAEMPRRALARVEHGNGNGLDETIVALERGYAQIDRLRRVVPFERQHGALGVRELVGNMCLDQVTILDKGAHAGLDLGAVFLGKVGQFETAQVPVRKQ